MTDKEKQVAEMAQDICGHCLKVLEEHECPRNENKLCFNARIEEAKDYYNLGYRKIPKDSVVLTKEQYKELTLAKQSIFDLLEEREDKARKETAREILKEFEYCNNKTFFTKWYDLCKQYGVYLGE